MLQFIKQSFNQAELFLIYVSFFNNQLLQDTKLLTLYNIFMFLSTIKKLLYPCTIIQNIPLTYFHTQYHNMPASPQTKPLPHTLSAYYPTTYAASPVTALFSSEQPPLLHTLSAAYFHL